MTALARQHAALSCVCALALVTSPVSAQADGFDICHFDWPLYVVDGVESKIQVTPGEDDCFLPGSIDVALTLGGTWPAALPPTVPIWVQAWLADDAAPFGWTCTISLRSLRRHPRA